MCGVTLADDEPVARAAHGLACFQVAAQTGQSRAVADENDRARVARRQSNANADAVLQLTNVYHNLLRRWAEV